MKIEELIGYIEATHGDMPKELKNGIVGFAESFLNNHMEYYEEWIEGNFGNSTLVEVFNLYVIDWLKLRIRADELEEELFGDDNPDYFFSQDTQDECTCPSLYCINSYENTVCSLEDHLCHANCENDNHYKEVVE